MITRGTIVLTHARRSENGGHVLPVNEDDQRRALRHIWQILLEEHNLPLEQFGLPMDGLDNPEEAASECHNPALGRANPSLSHNAHKGEIRLGLWNVAISIDSVSLPGSAPVHSVQSAAACVGDESHFAHSRALFHLM
ncbi:hypothetical protein QOT17_002097 [Balamuthia mandrillaris]